MGSATEVEYAESLTAMRRKSLAVALLLMQLLLLDKRPWVHPLLQCQHMLRFLKSRAMPSWQVKHELRRSKSGRVDNLDWVYFSFYVKKVSSTLQNAFCAICAETKNR